MLENGENGWWIILLFLFIFGGNGAFGGGTMQNYTLNSDFATLQRQIDSGFQSMERKGDQINNGLCDGFYAMNTGLLNGFCGVGNQIAETNRNIDSVNYNIQAQASNIMKNDCDNTQKILDAISQNQMNAMAQQIQQLQLNAALSNVVRYPVATTYAVQSPCFNGCGCNCNI